MNESVYKEIASLQDEIRQKQKEIIALRKKAEPEQIADYELKTPSGEKVLLSSLFDERNELLVIHNMGKACTYCTLWADELNGITLPLADRAPFVLVSPDAPATQQAFANSRNWKFPMLSAEGSSFIRDLGFYKDADGYYPGVSALIRENGKIHRVAYDYFGPGDAYAGIWHYIDLLPARVNGWQPKYDYKKGAN
ncbi:MAG: DUF899 family protein [Chitinophagales bacterium]